MALHVLTANVEFLEGVDLALVLPQLGDMTESHVSVAVDGFALTIGGLDEFITREDWKRVYDYWIAPRQAHLKDLSGSRPQGRDRPDIQVLIEALPMYRRKVRERLTVKAAHAWQNSNETQPDRKLSPAQATRRLRALKTFCNRESERPVI